MTLISKSKDKAFSDIQLNNELNKTCKMDFPCY